MKCKRIFKVVSALALTVALIVSTGVVSFAANYTTTTTYLNQNTIEVKSVATDLSKGAMATYVAYNGSFEAGAVYIDQKTANGTDPVEFTYQTSSDNVTATVKFGGSAVQEPVVATKDWWTINVQIDDEAAYTVEVPKAADNYEGDYLVREIAVATAAGKAIASVTVDNKPVPAWYAKGNSVFIYSNVIANGSNVVIKTAEADTIVKLGTVKAEKGKITAFAKATCAQNADYGILVGGDANLDAAVAWDVVTDYATQTVKLPALGIGNEGGFCVELQDDDIPAGTYKVAAYANGKVTATQDAVIPQ